MKATKWLDASKSALTLGACVDEGKRAHDEGLSLSDNPYKPNTRRWRAWRDGWLTA